MYKLRVAVHALEQNCCIDEAIHIKDEIWPYSIIINILTILN